MGAVLSRVAPLVAVLALACGSDKRSEADAPSAGEDTPTPAVPEPTKPAEPSTRASALLEWLDPDAVMVAFSRLPAELDADAFATVFAIPPKAARLLQDAAGIEEALDAVLPAEAPRPSEWLGPESLAMASMLGSGTYVVRPLVRPRAEVALLLQGARMRPQEVEGFTMLVPEGPFPFRIVFLRDDVVAFVPVREIGSGLGPLTAGRDLPAGAAERELVAVLEQEPDAALELYAAGPLLHFDLGTDLLQFAVRARKWQGGGLDVELRMQPDGDAASAADALAKRDVGLESAAIRALCGRVAFGIDGDFVEGRLQLTAEDVAVMKVRR